MRVKDKGREYAKDRAKGPLVSEGGTEAAAGLGGYSWRGVEPEGLASWYLRVIPNQFTVVTVQDVLNLVVTQGLGAKDTGFL